MTDASTASPNCLGARGRVACLLVAGLVTHSAGAQDDAFPARPITVLIPAAFGNTTLQMQVVAPCMAKALGKQVLVENRPGAGGAIAAGAVKAAKPDGYTLLFAATAVFSVVPHLNTATYTWNDFMAIGNLTAVPMLMAARSTAPYKTLKDLVAFGKSNPGVVNFASGGLGTSMQLTGEEMQILSNVTFTHIPFPGGGPAVQALMSGNADLIVAPPSILKPALDRGAIRPIALFSEARHPALPEVPTGREQGLDLVENLKSGLVAPKGLPPAVADKLVRALETAVKDEQCREQMVKINMDVAYMPPQQFDTVMRGEVARFEKLFSNPVFVSRVKR